MCINSKLTRFKINFQLPAPGGGKIPRFVWSYLYKGEVNILIDAGVAGFSSNPVLKQELASLDSLDWIAFTHCHPDHIGGAPGILAEFPDCKTAAHKLEVPFIANTDYQRSNRPIPGFDLIVEGPVRIDRTIKDGDTFGSTGEKIVVIETPGHSPGHCSFFITDGGVLITGDALPAPHAMTIYEDYRQIRWSIEKLLAYDNVEVLLSSWDEEVFKGKAARIRMQASLDWIDEIHRAVTNEHTSVPGKNALELAPAIVKRLDLPPYAANPLFAKTINTHLQVLNEKG